MVSDCEELEGASEEASRQKCDKLLYVSMGGACVFPRGAVTLTGDYSVGYGNSCIWIRPDQINLQPGCLPVGTVGSWGRP